VREGAGGMSYGDEDGTESAGKSSDKQGFGSASAFDSESITPVFGKSSQGRRTEKRRSLAGTVIETLLIVGAAFAIAMLAQTFLFRITGILQTSMQPTIDPGDRIIVNCLVYHFREPRPGEIVIIHDPLDDKKDIIKRVIALGGDTVESADGVLNVNGAVVEEPYVVNKDVVKGQARFVIPQGYIYVMGDNRPVSGDSRDFGPVAEDQIIGKVICVMWPIGHWRRL
jgi:signal peptidase I